MRGYWWSPDGDALLVARVDDTPVPRWHIADPEHPERPPDRGRLPGRRHRERPGRRCRSSAWTAPGPGCAGTPSATSTWSPRCWDAHELLIVVQPRDQRALRVLRVDPATGATELRHEQTDPAWVDIVPGVPAHTAAGALVTTADRGRRAPAGRRRPTRSRPPGCRCAAVLDVDGDTVLFSAQHRPVLDRAVLVDRRRARPSSPRSRGCTPAGWPAAPSSSPARTWTPTAPATTVRPHRGGGAHRSPRYAEPPGLLPRVTLLTAGERELRTALLLPSGHRPGTRLPVLMDPYGGPHAQRVLAARAAHLSSQWFADQGFAVVVVDGRGTPGRGPEFERAVRGDLAGPVLDDQVDALHAVAARSTRTWTWAGSASAAGRSAATWPRWPCCAARTSSTPRSPAPR